MQTELLDRQRWPTRVELANAIFDYIEGFYNRHRRHSARDRMSVRTSRRRRVRGTEQRGGPRGSCDTWHRLGGETGEDG
ncbi:hypothetical protein FCN18_33010 [Prauserella endophytica]|uniref:Integrase catalytic domain-containing protein n=1 Tax=Prauserella endophytica TaxID=1592324 RepID=A0ABY2RV75_9PSEU|nr:hypothetical protein FCN18_33010 [Prauserella endophytica]